MAYEQQKKIREKDVNHSTPLVALTAHSLASERKNLLNSGFNDYLAKPLSEEQLIQTLSKWTSFKENKQTKKYIKTAKNSNLIENGAAKEIVDFNPILDWDECLKLSGGKPKLALKMVQGLIEEAALILPIIESTSDYNLLLEPIHKLHGLCKYVGAHDLLHALDNAETELKVNTGNWNQVSNKLINTIQALLKFQIENPDWVEIVN